MNQPSPARRRTIAWGLATLIALLGCARPEPPAKPEMKPLVRVVAVRQGTVEVVVPAVGTVVPVEVSRVAAGAAGKVVTYPFREGALVRQDEVLAQLRDVTLLIQIEGAQQQLVEKEQQLAQLRAGYRPEEIAQAEAKSRAAAAAQAFADANLGRVRELYDRPNRPVSDQDLERAQLEADRTTHEAAAAEADSALKRAGYRPEEVAAAAAAAEAQRQVVAELNDELEKRTIRAPFTGYLVKKQAEVGEWIELGGEVATLVRLDEVEVRINVEEAFIHEVRPGQTVEVSIDAQPGATFPGTVRDIVPRAEWQSGSRSFPVIVRLANPTADGRPLLNEGMVARVQFRGAARPALLAHKDAILRTPEKSTVYVVGSDLTARPVDVQEGIAMGEFVEVTGELAAGDLLATEGAERLKPYVAVAIVDPPSPAGPEVSPEASEREPVNQAAHGEPSEPASGGD